MRSHFVLDLESYVDQLGNALRKLNWKPRWIGEVGHGSIQEDQTMLFGLCPHYCGKLRRSTTCGIDLAANPRFAAAKPAKYDEKR
jgi:hypothetical protein